MANYLNANELKNGNVFVDDGKAYVVLKYSHIKKARAQAVIKLRVKDILTDSITEKSYSSGTKLEEADVARRSAQFMYIDGQSAYFMDSTNFEQVEVDLEQLADQEGLMKDGQKVVISYLDNNPLSVELPGSVELEVVDAPDVSAGGTVTNPMKKVKLETGLEIDVPMFIKTGDVVRINTAEISYVTRV